MFKAYNKRDLFNFEYSLIGRGALMNFIITFK